LQWVKASEPLSQSAAGIKARHALSLTDAWIAASAQQIGATLLHKDPEFRAIAGLPQEWLG
jgi:predicted nucleic acid-binding protein